MACSASLTTTPNGRLGLRLQNLPEQRGFVDLAGRRLGQGRAEVEGGWNHVVREVRGTEAAQLGLGQVVGLARHDEDADLVADLVVRSGDDGELLDLRMAIEHR